MTGVGRVTDQLVRHYLASRTGQDDFRVMADAGDLRAYGAKLAAPWSALRYHTFALETSWQQLLWIGANCPGAEQFWKDVDLVYCPAESYVPVHRACLVCTIHDVAIFEPDLYPATKAIIAQRLNWRWMFSRFASAADAIITVSEFSKHRISDLFPELATRLHVVPNAPHSTFGERVNQQVHCEVERLTEGRPYVLVPGGLSFRKNADIVLAAWPLVHASNPDVQLVVAGSSDIDYKGRAQALQGFRLAGYVSDLLLNGLYSEASTVWVPSRYEGFGIPVLEAMACGAPVVASSAGALPEVAGSAAIFVPVDDKKAHAYALDMLLRNGKKRSELSIAGRQRARQFCWKKSAECLEELFVSLVDKR